MNRIWKALLSVLLVSAVAFTGACTSDADRASDNLSTAAENFEINRRVVFYNGITDSYILVVEGRCSVEPGATFTVTCKIGEGKTATFKKHFLGPSDNVTWFAEQLESAGVSTTHYRVIFKPTNIVPDVEVK